MPVQAAHRLEPPQAYTASKARQPPKLPRHRPYASCETCPTQTPCRQTCKLRSAREARAILREGDLLHLHAAATQTAIACLRSYIHAKLPARTPARRNRSRRRASSRVRASPRATDGMQKRTSSQRSRQPRQHSRRLRPRGANCGHCPVRRSVATLTGTNGQSDKRPYHTSKSAHRCPLEVV